MMRRRSPAGPLVALLLTLSVIWSLPSAARAASDVDLSTWSEERLFESALAAYRNGDCAWVLRVYRVLLGRDLDPQMRVWSLYNQALCLERGRFWEEAAESYQEIVKAGPEDETERDALFRLALVQERLKRYERAEELFREILERFPGLEPPDRRAVEVQIAWEQMLQGRERAALRRLNRLIEAWNALPEEERDAERYYLGEARVALGMLLSRRAAGIDFQRPACGEGLVAWTLARVLRRDEGWLRRRLAERESWMLAARAQYEQALRQKSPRWLSAAYYQLGMDLEAFYRALNEAPVPSRLTDSQREQYRQMLRERTAQYLEQASRFYHQGNNLAVGNEDESEFAEKLRRKVELLEEEGVDALGR